MEKIRSDKSSIVVINNVRYRRQDAHRLGLITDGKAFTSRSKNVGDTPDPDSPDPVEGDSAPASTSPDQTATGPERPARNASREEWAEYAKARGVTEEEIKDLKRDQISEIFPDTE